MSKQMLRDTMLYMPAKLLEGVIGMATVSLFESLFTPEAYGVWFQVNSAVLMGFTVLCAWLANAITRFVREKTEQPEARGAFYSTIGLAWLGLLAAVWLVCGTLAAVTGEWVFLPAAAMLTGYSLFQLMSSALVFLGRTALFIALSLGNAVLRLSAAYGAAALLPTGGTTPYPAMLAAITADLLCAVIALVALKIPAAVRPRRFSKALSRLFFRYGFPLIGVAVCLSLLNLSDRFIIGGMLGDDAVAYYTANYSLASAVFTMIMAGVMRGVYTSILKGYREGGVEGARPELGAAVRMYLLVALPCMAGLWAVSDTLSAAMFQKPGYHEAAFVIPFVAVGMFFLGLTEYNNKTWELTQKTTPILQNCLIAALFNVVANLLLIPVLGLMAAALNTLLAFVLYFTLSGLRARRQFIWHLPGGSLARIGLAGALCGGAAFGTTRLPLASPWLRLGLAVAAGALVYAGVLTISGEIRQELAYLKRLFQRKQP